MAISLCLSFTFSAADGPFFPGGRPLRFFASGGLCSCTGCADRGSWLVPLPLLRVGGCSVCWKFLVSFGVGRLLFLDPARPWPTDASMGACRCSLCCHICRPIFAAVPSPENRTSGFAAWFERHSLRRTTRIPCFVSLCGHKLDRAGPGRGWGGRTLSLEICRLWICEKMLLRGGLHTGPLFHFTP